MVSASLGSRASPSCDSRSTRRPTLLPEGLRQALDCRYQSEVVESGRAQLDRQPADVVQRGDDELADGLERLSSVRRRRRLLQRLQPEQDRRQRLTRLVVQLAGQSCSLELLRLDHPADGVPADPLGQVDGDRRTGSERLRQAQVVLAEDGDGPCLSCAITTPIGRPRTSSGT